MSYTFLHCLVWEIIMYLEGDVDVLLAVVKVISVGNAFSIWEISPPSKGFLGQILLMRQGQTSVLLWIR
jgi:hypothetical protein